MDKDGDSAAVDDGAGLGRCAARDVREGPRGLELEFGVRNGEEFDEAGDDADLDDFLDRGILFDGEKLAELRRGIALLGEVAGLEGLVEDVEALVLRAEASESGGR